VCAHYMSLLSCTHSAIHRLLTACTGHRLLSENTCHCWLQCSKSNPSLYHHIRFLLMKSYKVTTPCSMTSNPQQKCCNPAKRCCNLAKHVFTDHRPKLCARRDDKLLDPTVAVRPQPTAQGSTPGPALGLKEGRHMAVSCRSNLSPSSSPGGNNNLQPIHSISRAACYCQLLCS
jgi:hypothetical protein